MLKSRRVLSNWSTSMKCLPEVWWRRPHPLCWGGGGSILPAEVWKNVRRKIICCLSQRGEWVKQLEQTNPVSETKFWEKTGTSQMWSVSECECQIQCLKRRGKGNTVDWTEELARLQTSELSLNRYRCWGTKKIVFCWSVLKATVQE